MPLGSRNYGSELIFIHIETKYKVTVKKSQVEVLKKHEERDWHLIDNSHPEEVTKINETKRQEGIRVFREFVNDFGGVTDYSILKEYKIDNAVKDNSITKELPVKAAWEDEVSKKLYMENKIEFKNEVHAKNFIHNAGLHDFTPMIVDRLNRLDRADNILNSLVEQIRVHLEVENRTNTLLGQLIEQNKIKVSRQGEESNLGIALETTELSATPSLKYNIHDRLPKGWFD